jgi:hypothetical protein
MGRDAAAAWSPPALLYERTPGAAGAPLAPDAIYRRHVPEQTTLYQLVEQHLETALAEARLRTDHGYGYPRFVEQTLRDYLACGRRELGFARVRCGDCGYETLLAFSCKRRGLCPSCEGRRMAETAAHLVDRVLPVVPYRQWVLSLPIPLRLLLVRQPVLVSAVLKIFVRRVFAWQRRIARGMGIADPRCAAVTFIQRGGGALNLNPHFHTVFADGVFDLLPDGSVHFVPVLAPSDAEVEAICGQIARHVTRLVQPDDDALEPDEVVDDDTLSPTLPLALAPGPTSLPQARWEHLEQRPRPKSPRCASIDGFSLHAQTSVPALDRRGLERLCRYGLRSSFALSRLSPRDDGRLSYRLKRPWPDGRTELLLEPLDLLRRLAHLIPPARTHLVRYHGAFAPASPIRRAIRPRVLRESGRCCGRGRTSKAPSSVGDADPAQTAQTAQVDAPGPAVDTTAAPPESATDLGRLDPDLLVMLQGQPPDEADLLPVRQRRLDWSALLRRVYQIDVLRCPRCTGRMTVLAAINDHGVAQKILCHLGLPTDGPRCAPARAPPELELDFDGDDLDPETGFEGDVEPDDGFDPDVDIDPEFND